MFFSAYLGSSAGFVPWQEAVARHARWLGLSTRVERRALVGQDLLGFAWLEHESRRGESHISETENRICARTYGAASPEDILTAGGAVWDTLPGATGGNVVWLLASLPDGELSVVVPPTTPEQLYFTRTPHGWVLADDLRIFAQVRETVLDEFAVYALLQYSAIPSAFTLYKEVHRVPTGHVMRLRRDSPAVEWAPFFRPADLPRHGGDERDAEQRIQETLDAILTQVPPGTVLYFSGGVDSGLLAARFAHLGRRDVRLINYAFDAADEEHLVAVRMASHFGFTCELVPQAPEQATDVLGRAGRDYSFPFGDISAIPTNALVHGSLPWAGQSGVVVEGTGADGAYGFAASYSKWRRAYALPHLIRRQLARAYDWLDLWKFDSGLERAGRIVRKSATLPMGHAVVAQNALEGIAYDVPPPKRASFVRAVSEHLDAVTNGATPEDRISLLDLVWVCAGRMAPKSFDPLRLRGVSPIYPFLEPAMVSLSSTLSWETKCAGGQAKAILKRMLAREVPAEWVYRRKTGFTRGASARAMFASAPVQQFMHEVVLSSSNPLADYCRIDVVRRLVERARRHSLSVGAHIFLWTLAFASAWLRQQPEAQAPRGAFVG